MFGQIQVGEELSQKGSFLRDSFPSSSTERRVRKREGPIENLLAKIYIRDRTANVAPPNNRKKLNTSVTVVIMTIDANAGSIPNDFKPRGISAPLRPATIILRNIATAITGASQRSFH